MSKYQQYPNTMTQKDFMKADVSVIADQYVRIGEYQVVAGEAISLGMGEKSGQDDAQGRIYVDLKDTVGGDLDGKLRFAVYDPKNHFLREIAQFHTKALRTSETDRTKQLPFPNFHTFATEDRKLVIEFLSDTTATLDLETSKIYMDVTEQLIR